MVWAAMLRDQSDVVCIDRELDSLGDGGTAGRFDHLGVAGDICDVATLRAAGGERARVVVCCTGDPLINLQAAALVRDTGGRAPQRLVLVDERSVAPQVFAQLGG